MGTPKAELRLDGSRLVDRATAALRDACREVVVVGRAGLDVTGARLVVNADPDSGMRSSLALGIAAASDADAIAVLLVDTPGITAAAVTDVVAGWRPGRIAVADYGGRRGHPIIMEPALWRQAVSLAGPDEGARRLLATHAQLVDEVAVEGSPVDLDTPADLADWQALHG
jgi:molybdenum cofactor cytidylyltransferase/nicotine blue oxidoreductase